MPQAQVQQNATEENVTEENATTTTVVTEISPTGLSIRPEDLRNIVLLVGLIAVALVIVFRSNITNFLTRGRPRTQFSYKKPSFSLRNKIGRIKAYRLNIQLKRRRKLK